MATKQKDPAVGIEPLKGYTYEEVAEWLGVDWQVVRNLVRDGRMGYVKIGKSRGRRILGQHYLAYIAAYDVQPVA